MRKAVVISGLTVLMVGIWLAAGRMVHRGDAVADSGPIGLKAKPKPKPAKVREFSGNGIKNPEGIAVDGTGNVWVANYGGNDVSEIPAGATSSKSVHSFKADIYAPIGIAVDSANNVWVTNSNGTGKSLPFSNSVTELPASNPGAPLNITGGGLNNPLGIAVDLTGKIWVTNCAMGICKGNNVGTSTVTELNSNGSVVAGSPFLVPHQFITLIGISVEADNSIVIADPFDQAIIRLGGGNPSAFSQTGGASVGSALNFPADVTDDASGNVWVTNASIFSDGLSLLHNGNLLDPAAKTFHGAGISGSAGIAVDGANNVWVANTHSNSVTRIPPGGTGTLLEFTAKGLSFPGGIAIDGNGNVWVSSSAYNPAKKPTKAAGAVFEFIGVASPVKTPVIGPAQSK